MKILGTFKVNHFVNGEKKHGFVVVGLHRMEKDGNTYEFIKTYKLDKNCPVPADGTDCEPLYNERGRVGGRVAGWKTDG